MSVQIRPGFVGFTAAAIATVVLASPAGALSLCSGPNPPSTCPQPPPEKLPESQTGNIIPKYSVPLYYTRPRVPAEAIQVVLSIIRTNQTLGRS